VAGHSKWANIKRQKARVDGKKAKTFTQLSRAIIVAARSGLPDPAGNFQLRTAIEKAKAAGIPNDNIDRAIAKGAGKLGSDGNLEEIRYEGYGIDGVALIIEALTDNRNRTAADLRATFNKYGGNLGETGCVGWMFDLLGTCVLAGNIDEDLLLEVCLANDVDTYELSDDPQEPGALVFVDTTKLEHLSQDLQAAGFRVVDAEWRWLPKNTVVIDSPIVATQLLKLLDALEALDDIQSVTANYELTID
jgi:YebC/PmpR family DNA-binding regulatory protein